MKILGIDIGSYGIKGCIVDTEAGEILSDRYSTPPMEDSSPHKVLSQIHDVTSHFGWDGPIGCAFPAPIRRGVVLSTDRIDEAWNDADAEQLFHEITSSPVTVINDTDASGIAEMRFGAGQNQKGVVIVLTVGTGIGSSLFSDGKLVPNTELGRIEIRGITAEERGSNKVRKEEGLKKKFWGRRIDLILSTFEELFHPEMFILGGQLSRKASKTFPYINVNTRFEPASFLNDASMVGAAIAMADRLEE